MPVAVNEAAPPSPESPPSGHCLCGGVSYVVDGPVFNAWNCHCWRCRRWTGHHMAVSRCLRSDFRLVSDGTLAWHHPADDPNVAYGFCRNCGSSLFWKVSEGPQYEMESTFICAGTLDAPTGLHTERSVFTGRRRRLPQPRPHRGARPRRASPVAPFRPSRRGDQEAERIDRDSRTNQRAGERGRGASGP